MRVFYFTYLSSINGTEIATENENATENHMHPFHITVDRNQQFIFFIKTILYSQTKDKSKERLLECKPEI